MRVLTKNHPIEARIHIVGKVRRRFRIPQSYVPQVERILEKMESGRGERTVPWREASKDLFQKYGGEAAVVLRGARLKEGLSQIGLAKKIGITQANLSQMENGRRVIGKEMAKRLSRALNIDYRVFL